MASGSDLPVQSQQSSFAAGEVIFREGDAGHLLYVIRQGAVRLHKSIDGFDAIVDELHPGDFLGATGVIGNGTQSATAVATAPTQCLTLKGDTLEYLLAADVELSMRFIQTLAQRLAASHKLLELHGSRSALRRIAMALLRLAEASSERDQAGVWIRKRMALIGEELGVSPKELGEVSKQLMRQKLIRIKRDGVLVPDMPRMYDFVNGEPTNG